MSKRVIAQDYEEQDGWPRKLLTKWFGDGEESMPTEPEAFGRPEPRPEPTPKATRSKPAANTNGQYLQVHAHRGSQITKRVPRNLADAERAAEDLKERRPVIVNLEKADEDMARRVLDFISGVTYALNGFYERVGDKVFLFTPSNIIIADEDEVEPGQKGLFSDDEELD
jgi:cell division inhibitor SepF